jgi:hypothetical protein
MDSAHAIYESVILPCSVRQDSFYYRIMRARMATGLDRAGFDRGIDGSYTAFCGCASIRRIEPVSGVKTRNQHEFH